MRRPAPADLTAPSRRPAFTARTARTSAALVAFGALAVVAGLPAPAAGQAVGARDAAGMREAGVASAQVQVTARTVVVDREAVTRAGLDYLVLGNDRVRVAAAGGRSARGGGWDSGGGRGDEGRSGVVVGTHGVTAFLDLARERRWVRSESTQQVLTVSGGNGVISSTDLSVRRGVARTRGPSLVVSPRVLEDGSVHLRVSAGVRDRVVSPWGYGVDGSPAAVETEIVARDGQELVLASSASTTTSRESGLLGWGAAERGRDVLVAVTVRVVR